MRTVDRLKLTWFVFGCLLAAACGGQPATPAVGTRSGPSPEPIVATATLPTRAIPAGAPAAGPTTSLLPTPVPRPTAEGQPQPSPAATAGAEPEPATALASTPDPAPATATPPTPTATLPPADAGPEPGGTPGDGPKQAFPATQLASHLFVPVGESRSIDGLGELLETVHLTEPPSLAVGAGQATVTTLAGGISCLRFRYRDEAQENTVQTLCVVSFDEVGGCSGLELVGLDLQRYLEPGPSPAGNADLLESGQGLFYAACLTPAGTYRLQQPDRALSPLYFTIVDALTDGPYSLGDAEMDPQRAGTVVTFGGAEVRPPWIVTVSREISRIHLTDDAGIEFNDEDCSRTPSCTLLADALQRGDLLRISVGISIGDFSAALAAAPEAVLDRFFRERIGLPWNEVAVLHPDAAGLAFARLASLDLMGDLIVNFDARHGLREKSVAIGYWQPWPAQNPLPFPNACFPDDIVPGEGERCRRIEEAIQQEEARRIAGWLESGYDLWYAAHVEYAADGNGRPLSDARPDYSLFNGVIAGLGAHSGDSPEEIPAHATATLRRLAAEMGSETPVILSLNGPPVTSQTGGPFCEAEICPSDFRGMYEQTEAALSIALGSFNPEQLRGFGVSMFEGSHSDIREPHQSFQGFSLNRVGETGYNNPVLNIYRSQ